MKIMMKNCRVAFANGLYKASAFEEGQQPKFGADFIESADTKVFEMKTDANGVKSLAPTTMKAVMLAVANEAWPKKGQEMLDDFEASKKSYRNGNKRTDKNGDVYPGYEDAWYVTAKSPVRPSLFNAEGEPVTEEDGVIYSGCYVTAIFDVYANTKPKTRGVFAGLTGVKFYAEGESFGGGRVASAGDFDDGDPGDGASAEDLA